MYDPGTGEQLHDFNPGIAQSGLFWTVPVPSNAVSVDAAAEDASFEMRNMHMFDYITFGNSIAKETAPRPGVVSFKVTWSATGAATANDVPAKKFFGLHAPALSQMEWSGRTEDYTFASHPIASSSSAAWGALVGVQRSGSFY